MRVSPATKKASEIILKMVDALLEEEKFTLDQIAQAMGYKRTSGLISAHSVRAALTQPRRVAIERLTAGTTILSGDWAEFSAAAVLAKEQLAAIILDTPTQLLHPRIQIWKKTLDEMAELEISV